MELYISTQCYWLYTTLKETIFKYDTLYVWHEKNNVPIKKKRNLLRRVNNLYMQNTNTLCDICTGLTVENDTCRNCGATSLPVKTTLKEKIIKKLK
jgi:hypothetical protein